MDFVANLRLSMFFIAVWLHDLQKNWLGPIITLCATNISFFKPVVEISDVLESDIKLDYCVAPDAIFEF